MGCLKVFYRLFSRFSMGFLDIEVLWVFSGVS